MGILHRWHQRLPLRLGPNVGFIAIAKTPAKASGIVATQNLKSVSQKTSTFMPKESLRDDELTPFRNHLAPQDCATETTFPYFFFWTSQLFGQVFCLRSKNP